MIVTVTSIKLRSVFNFFRLSMFGLKIMRQAKSQKGFVKMENTGFGYLHYTISMWESMPDVKNFAKTGAHLDAMKSSGKIADEVRIYTYESNDMPDWKEAKKLVFEKGKVIRY